jgi:cysteine-rich repeat protein
MGRLLQRLVQMAAILAGLSFVLFGLLSAMPGDPIDLLITSNPAVKPEDVVRLKKLRGLDKPWTHRYLRWLWGHHPPLPTPRVSAPPPTIVALGEDGRASARVDLSASLAAAGYGEGWSWQPLFAAHAEGQVLRADVADVGLHRQWFAVKSAQGLLAVGHADVWAGPAALAEGQTLEQAARAAPRRPLVQPVGPRLADDDASYLIEPATLVDRQGAPWPADVEVTLSVGSREGAGWRMPKAETGQTLVLIEAGDANGAFVFEQGPTPDPDRFERGFLFALVGDREALGFSNTYKRPVWEILFGPQMDCGNGRREAGESCDDGNTTDGDGCSATCHDEQLSFLGRIDVEAAGAIISSGRVFNTLSLMLPALLLSFLLALPIGVLAATRQYSWVDYVVNFLAFVGISLPVFWFGIMLMALFAEKLHWLPAGGLQTPGISGGLVDVLIDRARYTLLPASVLGIVYAGRWLRYMRASMLEVLPLDFIRTARAKGLSEKAVVLKHALRNALIPVVTVLALSLPSLFGGALLTEWVFSWPGLGRLQFDAVMSNDSYLAIVVFLVSATLVMVGNLIADGLYVLIDPRMRRSGR